MGPQLAVRLVGPQLVELLVGPQLAVRLVPIGGVGIPGPHSIPGRSHSTRMDQDMYRAGSPKVGQLADVHQRWDIQTDDIATC